MSADPVLVARIVRALRHVERRHYIRKYESGQILCSCGELIGMNLEVHHDEMLTQRLA